MNSIDPESLIAKYGIISNQVDPRELSVILRELSDVLEQQIPGAIVEFGCYTGTTSLYLRRVIDMIDASRELHVYDSFAGLPEKTAEDSSPAGEQFKAGELSASKKEFITNFKKAGLRLPYIHKGWFKDTRSSDVPEQISFAFLDGDYYESIMDPLKLIGPRLSRGAVIIIDDYMNEALPGAAIATDEWLRAHPARMNTVHSLAVIHT